MKKNALDKILKFLKWGFQFKIKIATKMLRWLSGKKGVIASIILTVTGYLGAKGTLGELEVIFIGSIVTILFGGASYATGKLVYKK